MVKRSPAIALAVLLAALLPCPGAADPLAHGPLLLRAEGARAYARSRALGSRLATTRTPPLSGNGLSCISCHVAGAGVVGAEQRYPRHDAARGRVVTLEEKIALEVRDKMLGEPPLPGSARSVALMVWVRSGGR